jgi:hypothetical protein
MKENELVRDMYSCLNLIINEILPVVILRLYRCSIIHCRVCTNPAVVP